MRAPAAAATALAAAAALAGCASSDPPRPEPAPLPPPGGTGYYVGTGSAGIGASVDLLASDPVIAAIDAALAARDGRPGVTATVGVASVVNDGPRFVRAPRFVAELVGGGATPLRPASALLGGGPLARRALARLGAGARQIPPRGAITLYVVADGIEPAAIARVRMVMAGREPITLAARRR